MLASRPSIMPLQEQGWEVLVVPTKWHVCEVSPAASNVLVLSTGLIIGCIRHWDHPAVALMLNIAQGIGRLVARHQVGMGRPGMPTMCFLLPCWPASLSARFGS